MTRAGTAGVARTARWVVLLCTVFGLATMHTLGHAGTRMDADSTPVASPVQAATAVPVAFMAAAVDLHCAGDHCGGQHHHGGMSGWSVCLAVLGGLALFGALVLLILGVLRRHGRPRRYASPAPAAPRAPPRRRVGLTVASATVLRI